MKKMWTSVPPSPVSMAAGVMNAPTRATMGSTWTFQLSSATDRLLDSSVNARQALMVSNVAPGSREWPAQVRSPEPTLENKGIKWSGVMQGCLRIW